MNDTESISQPEKSLEELITENTKKLLVGKYEKVLEAEELLRQQEHARLRSQIEQEIVAEMRTTHPINELIDSTQNLDLLYKQVLEYLQKPLEPDEPSTNKELGRPTLVKIWKHLLQKEAQDPESVVPNLVRNDEKDPVEFQLNSRRNEIVVTLIDAFAHSKLPELPNIRVNYKGGLKQWTKLEVWNSNIDQIKPYSDFLNKMQEEMKPIQNFLIDDPKETLNRSNVSTIPGPELSIDSVTPLDLSRNLFNNVNNVMNTLSQGREFAIRFLLPPGK